MNSLDRLLAIMAALRHPETGCPWDVEQTFQTIAPYTVEEAYEVADAIDQGDLSALKEELGDLLLQVVYHARMAEEQGAFAFDDVAQVIGDKMVRRHPHVFGSQSIADAEAQTANWERLKAEERAAKAADAASHSLLDGVARALPPMTRALKLQNRAARVGFDWPDAVTVIDKIEEEVAEIKHEIITDAPFARLEDEMGDVLFACINLARKLKIDPEQAVKRANAKFERRFKHIESSLAAAGRLPQDATLDEMETLWTAAKRGERE